MERHDKREKKIGHKIESDGERESEMVVVMEGEERGFLLTNFSLDPSPVVHKKENAQPVLHDLTDIVKSYIKWDPALQ